MNWKTFHHPDLSLPVLRRQLGNELLDMFAAFGDALSTQGWSTTWNHSSPSRTAYYAATYRLRKAGLIASRDSGGGFPILGLTEAGEAKLSEVHKPWKYWDRKWNEIWYVLVYDVPEQERAYRTALRGFLSRMRMGCLQRSVWVTPQDVRPEYADLDEAAAVQEVSYLFEMQTVLGRGSSDIVISAWDFERLKTLQSRYWRVYSDNLEKLVTGKYEPWEILQVAREEMEAYLYAMEYDPLLPRGLWPSGYTGEDVWALHQEFMKTVRRKM